MKGPGPIAPSGAVPKIETPFVPGESHQTRQPDPRRAGSLSAPGPRPCLAVATCSSALVQRGQGCPVAAPSRIQCRVPRRARTAGALPRDPLAPGSVLAAIRQLGARPAVSGGIPPPLEPRSAPLGRAPARRPRPTGAVGGLPGGAPHHAAAGSRGPEMSGAGSPSSR